MAINIFLIPLMSDKLERVFLGARRIITWERVVIIVEILKIREYFKY